MRHLLAAVLDRGDQVLLRHLPGRQHAHDASAPAPRAPRLTTTVRQSGLKSRVRGQCRERGDRVACRRRKPAGLPAAPMPPAAPSRSPVAARCAIGARRAPCAHQARARGRWRATSPGCRDSPPPQSGPGRSGADQRHHADDCDRSLGRMKLWLREQRLQPLIVLDLPGCSRGHRLHRRPAAPLVPRPARRRPSIARTSSPLLAVPGAQEALLGIEVLALLDRKEDVGQVEIESGNAAGGHADNRHGGLRSMCTVVPTTLGSAPSRCSRTDS